MVDTDVMSSLLWRKGRHEEYREFLVGRSFVALSFVTVAELRGGAKAMGARRQTEMEHALRRFVVVPYDSAVVDVYATLHASKVQETINRKDANDLWNAACAVASVPSLPLLTNNLSDYKKLAAVIPLKLVHPDI